MLSDLTYEEIRTILIWSMDAADRAKRSIAYYPAPYEKAKAIHDKVHEEICNRKRERA